MSYIDEVPEQWLIAARNAMTDASIMVMCRLDESTAPIVTSLVAFAAEVRAIARVRPNRENPYDLSAEEEGGGVVFDPLNRFGGGILPTAAEAARNVNRAFGIPEDESK